MWPCRLIKTKDIFALFNCWTLQLSEKDFIYCYSLRLYFCKHNNPFFSKTPNIVLLGNSKDKGILRKQKKNKGLPLIKKQKCLSPHHRFDKTSQQMSILLKNSHKHLSGAVCIGKEIPVDISTNVQKEITPLIVQRSPNSFNETHQRRGNVCCNMGWWGDKVRQRLPSSASRGLEMAQILEVPWQVIHIAHMEHM